MSIHQTTSSPLEPPHIKVARDRAAEYARNAGTAIAAMPMEHHAVAIQQAIAAFADALVSDTLDISIVRRAH